MANSNITPDLNRRPYEQEDSYIFETIGFVFFLSTFPIIGTITVAGLVGLNYVDYVSKCDKMHDMIIKNI